jgi:serine/threonine-protein kinase RsbW
MARLPLALSPASSSGWRPRPVMFPRIWKKQRDDRPMRKTPNADTSASQDVVRPADFERLSNMSAKLAFEVGNDLKALAATASRVQAFGEQHQIESALMGKVNLCIEELLANIIHYGTKGEASGLPILVNLELIPGGLQVEVVDSGSAFDPFTDAPSPDLDSDLEERPIGGLGVHLVKVLADRYEYHRESAQNRVALTFSLA